jgi:hypothetical protein
MRRGHFNVIDLSMHHTGGDADGAGEGVRDQFRQVAQLASVGLFSGIDLNQARHRRPSLFRLRRRV